MPRSDPGEPSRRPLTLKQLALAARLSYPVVASIMSGNQPEGIRYSDDTRARVLALAKQLGYHRNRTASNLRHSRHRAIGIYCGNNSYVVPPTLLAGLLEGCAHHHLLPVVEICPDSPPAPPICLRERCIDGLLVFDRDDHFRSHHRQLGLPCLSINAEAGEALDQVTYDEAGAMEAVVAHLVGNGCRRLALLGHSGDRYWTIARRATLRRCCAAHGLTEPIISERPFTPQAHHLRAGYADQARELLRSHPLLDGIICESEYFLLPLYEEAAACGRQPGGDLAVVSWTRTAQPAWIGTGVTTVSLPFTDIGRHLVDALVERIAHPDQPRAAERMAYVLEPRPSSFLGGGRRTGPHEIRAP